MVEDEALARGRPRTADGRRKLVTARVSEAKFAAIKAASAGMSRSEWVEAAIDAYLVPPVPVAAPFLREPAVPVYGNPDLSGPSESVYGNDEPPAAPACKHPAASVEADVCGECGSDVW